MPERRLMPHAQASCCDRSGYLTERERERDRRGREREREREREVLLRNSTALACYALRI